MHLHVVIWVFSLLRFFVILHPSNGVEQLKEKRLKKWVWKCVCGEEGGNIAEISAGGCCRNAEEKKLQKWWKGRGDGICRDGVMFGFNYFHFLIFYFVKNNKLQLLKIQRDHSPFYGTILFRKVYCAYWN